MKKLLAIVLSLAMALSLAACGTSGENAADTGNKDGDALVLSIGTSPDFPPFENLNGDGSVTGIEIDILNQVCEELGWTLEINQMDFDSVIPGVQAGKFDLGVSGITVTEDRKKNALFTSVYCMAAQAIVVLEGSDITCKADLEGKAVSVQTGTTAESFCTEQGYDVKSFQANNDAQSALINGKVDAWVIDDLTAADMVATYEKSNPGVLVILDEAMTSEPYAFAANLEDQELVDQINSVLDKMIEDGTVAQIFEDNGAPYTSPLE